jgi:hypothetical protein
MTNTESTRANGHHDVAATGDGTAALHPRIAELMHELDSSRAELRALVASLPAETLTAPAGENEWSVAAILEHLSMVEDGAGRLFTNISREVEATGARETDTSSVLGLNDRFQIATSPIKVVAPERIQPKAGLSVEESMARLETARKRLKEAMTRASGLALGNSSMPHPLFGPINGYQWVLATAQHERRHTRQIRRVAGLDA